VSDGGYRGATIAFQSMESNLTSYLTKHSIMVTRYSAAPYDMRPGLLPGAVLPVRQMMCTNLERGDVFADQCFITRISVQPRPSDPRWGTSGLPLIPAVGETGTRS